MNNTYSINITLQLKRQITDDLRVSVIEDLPELNDLKNPQLKHACIEAWSIALAGSSFNRLSDLPGEAFPDKVRLKTGGQNVHLRGVAQLAMNLASHLKLLDPNVDIDEDILLAGALCHDLGKPFEFDPINRTRWKADPSRTGFPPYRHSVYGAHIALVAGLPEAIAHIAVGHSMEGDNVVRSLECNLVHYADEIWWKSTAAAGLIDEKSMEGILKNFASRPLKDN